MSKYVPKFGDYIWIELSHQAGHEQKGRRPCLVISQYGFNKISKMAFVCPITTNSKKFPFRIQLPESEPVSGYVLTDQLKSLDFDFRNAEFAGEASQVVCDEVLGICLAIMEG